VQIIWAGPRPVVGGPMRADISPPVPLRETLALMCRAQRMVMTLNNFSHSLSERLLSAMSRGCIPVTQSNVLIDGTFAEGDVIVRLEDDLANLADVLGQEWTVREFADRSAAAKRRVASAFSPATRVREFLTQMKLVDGR
jgi:hypothetical protein